MREQGRKTARNLHIFETVSRPKSILLVGLPLLFLGVFLTGKEEENKRKYQSANPETGRLKRKTSSISLYQDPKTKEWVRTTLTRATKRHGQVTEISDALIAAIADEPAPWDRPPALEPADTGTGRDRAA